MTRLGAWIWPWLLAAGCYSPTYDHPACSENFRCPDGLRCNGSSLLCEDESLPCVSFSSQFDTCMLPPVNDLLIDDEASFDTSSLQLYEGGFLQSPERMMLHTRAKDVAAILAHDVRIAQGVTLVASGGPPLAIVASGRITIEAGASIDVSAVGGDIEGGAGSTIHCPVPAGEGEFDDFDVGGGGGGGGGFNGRGGAGGAASSGRVQGGNGAGSIDAPAGPQGGCGGAYGGGYSRGGHPGVGGGAIYLVAAFQIDIGAGARLLAVGSGGRTCGTAIVCGGGGGGSGGMIMLEAPSIIAPQAKLSANGGGGGGGCGPLVGLPGADGLDSTERAARGAAGGVDSTPGGFGGSRLEPMGDDVTTTAGGGGGGGGGGGAGYIIAVSSDVQLSDGVSPAPILRSAAARDRIAVTGR